jgi:aminobenzoyl-glutamate utilization protein B
MIGPEDPMSAHLNACTSAAIEWIDAHAVEYTAICDEIWRNPELPLAEHGTARLLSGEAERHGFAVERGVAGMPTAFVASWGSGRPVIALMGELDALPGLSQRAVPVREPIEEGAPGHGCGHNIHGTTALAAAVALRHVMERHRLGGTVVLFGCPAEETVQGKVRLVRAGRFRGVDAALSHHPSSANTAHAGSSLALDSVKFHFRGVSSHAAAAPESGRSALDAVELMNVGANYLREHMIEKARLHYVIQDGGGQPNVVPPRASSWYYIRAPERAQVDEIRGRLLDIARGADLMAGTSHEVELVGGCHDLVPNRSLIDLVIRAMRAVGAPRHTPEEIAFGRTLSQSITAQAKREGLAREARPGWEGLLEELFDERILEPWTDGQVLSASTDVGDVSWVTPTTEFSTAACILGTPGHSWQFAAQLGMSIGHKSLLFAAKAMAVATVELLLEPERLDAAREEWKKRMDGRSYSSPGPGTNTPGSAPVRRP